MANACTHLDQIKIMHTKIHVCEDCVKIGDTWVHLRLCLSCGHVGCCDSSDRKSTRLNSSHANISYAVFCLKKKDKIRTACRTSWISSTPNCAFRCFYRR